MGRMLLFLGPPSFRLWIFLEGTYELDCNYIALASGGQPARYQKWTPRAFCAPPGMRWRTIWGIHVEIHMSIHFFRVHMDRGVFSLEKVCTSMQNPHGPGTHMDHHMAIHMPRSTEWFNAMRRSLLSEFSGKAPKALESS